MNNFTPGQIRILRETILAIPETVLCEFAKEELVENVPEMWQLFVNPTLNNKPILKDNESQIIVTLMMLELSVFVVLFDDSKGKDFFVFSPLMCSIANSIAAIEQLAISGFDFQAYTLMRTLVEQYIALITLSLCPEKRKTYYRAMEKEDARRFWHDSFTKTKFFKMLNGYKEDPDGLLSGHFEKVYRELSSFTHNSFWHNFSKTYVPNSEGTGVKPNLFGEYVSRAEQIISDMAYDIWPFHMLFVVMLNDSKIDIGYDAIKESEVYTFFVRVLKHCNIIERALFARIGRKQKEDGQS